ncbi:sulfur carrier protein ThiS [Hymenobacter sp. BT186]|uniref:Sulfur carrier protein ThiS n=1 Tax=Hymenobacter telluris TaxID=2816474 RepID=A0A939EUE7_9BACT|nr:sulfur carrier protein ThiS [Hymenobacter telluris]MBO0358019.1 sulfur carrier protein ThiS [Hymenobacter telluris]MBW3374046.1 sulfur carrier protein ThiS [Hymenobacter norwichensis]
MIYYVNNTPQEAPAARTIAEALAELSFTSPRGVAVAVNGTVVPRPEWPGYALQPHDRLTIIRATQGG